MSLYNIRAVGDEAVVDEPDSLFEARILLAETVAPEHRVEALKADVGVVIDGHYIEQF